ncbi:MAG: hypothetical protein HQK75_03030 [Candidatus Magnetomorum sp.]|nr:hypothetical protein [Candidatus Magnetomorum sp.]
MTVKITLSGIVVDCGVGPTNALHQCHCFLNAQLTILKSRLEPIRKFVRTDRKHTERFIQNNVHIFARLESVENRQHVFELETGQNFEKVFQALDQNAAIPKQGIFFDGQVYDAYTFISDLIRSAKKSLMLIDNFIDDSVLTLLSKRKSNISATPWVKSRYVFSPERASHNMSMIKAMHPGNSCNALSGLKIACCFLPRALPWAGMSPRFQG